MALHDLNLAAAACDRLALLQDGALVAIGPPADALLNRVETLRDPSHFRVHTLSGWTRLLQQAGFSTVTLLRRWKTPVVLEEWFQRAKTRAEHRKAAIRLLSEAPQPVRDRVLCRPFPEPDQLILRKGMWIATR